MSRLALYVLGPPRIERDGVPVQIRRRNIVALLAYLAVTGRSHSRDALATLFWPEHDQSGARAGLRRTLASLKKALGAGWLEVSRESVGLCSQCRRVAGSGQVSGPPGRVLDTRTRTGTGMPSLPVVAGRRCDALWRRFSVRIHAAW